MPVSVSFPGVYVQEVGSGVRTITGVSTSIALFIGMTRRGRLRVPTLVLSFADYQRSFGTDTTLSEMTDQVRQFFLNGGTSAYVVRIADDDTAKAAQVTLKNEDTDDVLTLTAKEAGLDSNLIRVEVDYATPSPESTFNLRIFRLLPGGTGIEADETFANVSMDPLHPRFVESIVNQQSTLVDVAFPVLPSAGKGHSRSGILVGTTDDVALQTLNDQLSQTINGVVTQTDRVSISVDGHAPVTVTLPKLTVPAANAPPLADPLGPWAKAVNDKLLEVPLQAAVSVKLVTGPTDTRYVEFRSDAVGGSVVISPAPVNSGAVRLQLGVGQGGLEVGGHAALRPAPTGFFATFGDDLEASPFTNFAGAKQSDFTSWTLADSSGLGPHTASPFAGANATDRMYTGTASNVGVGSLLNVRQNLQILANSIGDNTRKQWRASLQGFRLVLRPAFGGANSDTLAKLSSTTFKISDTGQLFEGPANAASYGLGKSGAGAYQQSGTEGVDGSFPRATDYSKAFEIIDSDVDLFNLMLLPRASGQGDPAREEVWGLASIFCQTRRAVLLMDPRESWKSAKTVKDEISDLRIGVVTDFAAIYWPRLQVSSNGTLKAIDPSGSIAGLMARTDANRGVWKAPAGIEGDLRGIRGVERTMSDPENGLINPEAVNAIRVFPTGIVSWGARTMAGFDNSGKDDYRYLPVRRVALFIEESLYRGLKFAVFEPNDEPLWAQIRIAAGAFMNNLFRQGAFQGSKASQAYFVKVDAETTTQNDINLGIVNVVVGFAPLKPAEFVVITLQQIAGQVQT